MFLPLDGPAKPYSLTVDNMTVVEVVDVDGIPNDDRDVVTIQPLGDSIWVYFGIDNIVPSALVVARDGIKHFKSVPFSYEAGPKQRIYILAINSTANVRVAERG